MSSCRNPAKSPPQQGPPQQGQSEPNGLLAVIRSLPAPQDLLDPYRDWGSLTTLQALSETEPNMDWSASSPQYHVRAYRRRNLQVRKLTQTLIYVCNAATARQKSTQEGQAKLQNDNSSLMNVNSTLQHHNKMLTAKVNELQIQLQHSRQVQDSYSHSRQQLELTQQKCLEEARNAKLEAEKSKEEAETAKHDAGVRHTIAVDMKKNFDSLVQVLRSVRADNERLEKEKTLLPMDSKLAELQSQIGWLNAENLKLKGMLKTAQQPRTDWTTEAKERKILFQIDNHGSKLATGLEIFEAGQKCSDASWRPKDELQAKRIQTLSAELERKEQLNQDLKASLKAATKDSRKKEAANGNPSPVGGAANTKPKPKPKPKPRSDTKRKQRTEDNTTDNATSNGATAPKRARKAPAQKSSKDAPTTAGPDTITQTATPQQTPPGSAVNTCADDSSGDDDDEYNPANDPAFVNDMLGQLQEANDEEATAKKNAEKNTAAPFTPEDEESEEDRIKRIEQELFEDPADLHDELFIDMDPLTPAERARLEG